MWIRGAALATVAALLSLTGCESTPVTPPPKTVPRFAFAISGSAIVTYSVNGAQLPHGSTWRPSGERGDLRPLRYLNLKKPAHRLLTEPNARLVFEIDTDFNLSLLRYDAQTGALSVLAENVLLNNGPSLPNSKVLAIALHPAGRHLVVGFHPPLLSQAKVSYIRSYEIDQATGTLTYRASAASGVSPWSLAFDAAGRNVYTSNLTTSEVRSYAFDSNTGGMTAIGAAQPVTYSGDLKVHPSGDLVYVAESGTKLGDQRVWAFRRAGDGTLTRFSQMPLPGEARQLIVHPSGSFLYVLTYVNPNIGGVACICVYRIIPATGALDGPIQQIPAGSDSITMDRAGEFLYVPGRYVNVMTPDAATGKLTLVLQVRSLASVYAVALADGPAPVSFQPRHLFVTDVARGRVLGYAVNLITGTPEVINSSAAIPQPTAIAADPDGRNLYVASATNTLTTLGIGSDGKLTVLGSTPLLPIAIPVGIKPSSITVEPSGRFLFIALRPTTYLVVANRDTDTGAVTITASSYVQLGPTCEPAQVVADPAGRFTFVSCVSGNMVVLETQPGGSPKVDHTLTISADSMAAEPYGKYVYALHRSVPSITSYLVALSGTTLAQGSARSTGSGPASIAIDPLGRFVYTADSGTPNLSLFPVRDDALEAGTTAALPASTTPVAARVDPSGHWLYVLHDPGPKITTYAINQATGALAPTGPVINPPGSPIGTGGDMVLTTRML
jgi:6-phosphogluconolactonase (cycloisomerase 2 family)